MRHGRAEALVRGIIPAYAGSTCAVIIYGHLNRGSSPHTRGAQSLSSAVSLFRRDHPRIRGEHGASSPRNSIVPWIIPAYAGSTGAAARRPPTYLGSSPHTRGALPSTVAEAPWKRIIPAYAGSTPFRARDGAEGRGIIPAYAGSTAIPRTALRALAGSSPHTRGAPNSTMPEARSWADHPRIRGEHCLDCRAVRHWLRIIPAYAGST